MVSHVAVPFASKLLVAYRFLRAWVTIRPLIVDFGVIPMSDLTSPSGMRDKPRNATLSGVAQGPVAALAAADDGC
jgi:hypothetical protein